MVPKVLCHSPFSLENICDFFEEIWKSVPYHKDSTSEVLSLQVLVNITPNLTQPFSHETVVSCGPADWLKHREVTFGQLSCRWLYVSLILFTCAVLCYINKSILYFICYSVNLLTFFTLNMAGVVRFKSSTLKCSRIVRRREEKVSRRDEMEAT
jgi:hypothetical protein